MGIVANGLFLLKPLLELSLNMVDNCGFYCIVIYNATGVPEGSSLAEIVLSLFLLTLRTLSAKFLLSTDLTPFFTQVVPLFISFKPSLRFLDLAPFHLVSCMHRNLMFCLCIKSTRSLPFAFILHALSLPMQIFLTANFFNRACH